MAQPTRPPGSQEPFEIFRDDFFENTTPDMSHAPMPTVTKPKRALSTSSSNVVLNPPSSSANKNSPIKHARPATSPLAPLKPNHGRLGQVTMVPPTSKGSSTDSLQKKPYLSKFKTVAQKPMANDLVQGFGKENVQPQLFPAPPTISFESFDNYYMPPQKAPGKRMLMDAAPIKEARPTKKTKTDEGTVPAYDSFPHIVDDGAKPGHSYAQLIGMAILRSPNRRLTLAQIYKWISDTFKFYKAEEAGWQNSIRHNLSLHKAFIKVERPKDDPGKGNYWTIQEGMEQQFIKEKPTRKTASTNENIPVMSTRLEPSRPMTASHPEPTLPPPAPFARNSLPPMPTSQATLPAEISSDATIPVSDPAAPEDAQDKPVESEAHTQDHMHYSPAQPAMHSSPPVPRNMGSRSRTPPPVARAPATSSVNRSHKRKFASMDDSGYISSLESSVMRPNQKASLLTSEADRPRSKRSRAGREGRAELEIARLRASSYDSPSKGRSLNSLAPPSSSPLRTGGQMLPPLTPAMKLKPPQKPPPSASPNTNLQIHRDQVRAMLQSPLRKISGVGEEPTPWSPAFNIETSLFDVDGRSALGDFNVWSDLDDALFGAPLTYESPCKKSAKRPKVDRSQSTTALTDVTSTPHNVANVTSTPLLLKGPAQAGNITWETPSKIFSGLDSSPTKPYSMQSPTKAASPQKTSASVYDMPADGFFPGMFDGGAGLDQENEDFPLDICQGFQKIGSGSQLQQSNLAKNNVTKPGLGRSYTSQF